MHPKGNSKKNKLWVLFLVVIIFLGAGQAVAQQNEQAPTDLPDPKGALWRSALMPGWGHYYVDQNEWDRGKYHLAAEVVMLAAYVGLRVRTDNLETDLITYARSKAGTNLENRGRQYRLAVGNFDNREAYNKYYQRTRNWDRLYPEKERFQWNWTNKEARVQYKSLQERIDKIDRQLPALVSLMIVNRVVSGISAYLQARDMIDQSPKVGLGPTGNGGVATRIKIPF